MADYFLYATGRGARSCLASRRPYTDVSFWLIQDLDQRTWALVCWLMRDEYHWSNPWRMQQMSKIVKELIKQRKADTGIAIVADDEWLRSIAPTVHELLVTQLKDEGTTYEPAGLFLYGSCGSWCASLSNRKLRFKRRGEGPTIEAAIADLETRLGREDGEGRSSQRPNSRSARNGQTSP